MTCANGHEAPEGSQFCPTCGISLVDDDAGDSTAERPNHLGADTETGFGAVPPQSRRRKPTLLIVAVVAALVIAAGVVIGGGLLLVAPSIFSDEQENTLRGQLRAPECGGGYAIENASVEVRDENGTLIGSGFTSSDQITAGSACRVDFQVDDIPKADFYQVKIGTHGGPSYTYEQLSSQDWFLSLTLGRD
jgi:hypothetical protein